jgi:serine/threonine protein kinase
MIAGRYRFDRRLGRGGMGVVYEAFDSKLKRQVAVKVIRPDLIASADAVARFRREARAAASLSHPSVVRVHDFGVADDDRAYLVMELLKGRSLREELREHGPMETGRALGILRDVSAAISLAHENGLVHRDLKPENIFLSRSDRGEVATILDFGLVKPIDPGVADTVAHTVPGAPVGTPAYMSPEQQRGETPDQAWDVWALAVVAFEVLTGTHPSAAPAVSPAPASFFEGALSPDRSRRPVSIRQFMDGLESALRVTGPDAAS